jgi:hypothetical protein
MLVYRAMPAALSFIVFLFLSAVRLYVSCSSFWYRNRVLVLASDMAGSAYVLDTVAYVPVY